MATTRVISTTVTFVRPFMLDGFDELQRPGSYVVDTEQELIDSPSVAAWRRISTVMQLNRHGGTEYVPIDPDQLSEALNSRWGAARPRPACFFRVCQGAA